MGSIRNEDAKTDNAFADAADSATQVRRIV